MSKPITVLVQFHPNQGAEAALAQALREAIAQTTANAACSGAELLADDTGTPRLVETWDSVQAHEAYVQSLVDAGVMNRVMEMCTAPPVSRYFAEVNGELGA